MMINIFIRFLIKKYIHMDLKIISLPQIYSSTQLATKRYSAILNRFKQIYGQFPQHFARAPGRVNLIGEHIDYEGYGVLPFAIQKDCLIAFQVTDENKIELNHINPKYPSCVLSNDPFQEVNYPDDYVKYFVAGYRAATKQVISLENLSQQSKQNLIKHKFKGLKLLIEGSVPIAAGLSSSASFVICSALLTSFANDFHHFVKKQFLIQQAIKYQKLVGMAGGGMDQSISMLGNRQSALYIQFDPIRSERVNLPPGYKFVIMNSLVESKKLQTIGTQYNKRVCQCIAAVRILSKNLKVPHQLYNNWKILRQLQQYLNLDLPTMARLVDEFLPRKIYTKEDIEKELQTQLQNIFKSVINHQIVIKVNKSYNLYEAAKHVYQQANRVLSFIKICNSQLQPNAKATVLGALMNQSQTSCRQLYNCSSLEIDQLTTIAREEGALGSRLTGAGWGGCTISLLPEQKVQLFKSVLQKRFYTKQNIRSIAEKHGIQNVIFQTIPACGASLVGDWS